MNLQEAIAGIRPLARTTFSLAGPSMPRTTTRERWKQVDRYRRTIQRLTRQAYNEQAAQAAIAQAVGFGMSEVQMDMLVNPPLIVPEG